MNPNDLAERGRQLQHDIERKLRWAYAFVAFVVGFLVGQAALYGWLMLTGGLR